MNFNTFIFAITYLSEVLLLFLIIVSIINRDKRFWPPPSKNSFEFYIIWTLSFISIGGIIVLAVINWNDVLFSDVFIRLSGVILIFFGNALAIWGVKSLSVKASTGLKHKLVTHGPYRYTRNPQYLGDIIVLMGVVLLSSSIYVIITCILGILIFYLLPYAEEPWLEEMYGEEYIEYKKKTPRFIGLKTIKRILKS